MMDDVIQVQMTSSADEGELGTTATHVLTCYDSAAEGGAIITIFLFYFLDRCCSRLSI